MTAHSETRALLKRAPGVLELTTVPLRPLRDDEVLLRVVAVGICGTDLHIARDEYAHEPPVVLGHEIAGEVIAVGGAADASLLGVTVVCETFASTCGRCEPCLSGRRNLCTARRSLGSHDDGGFADFVIVPARNLHPVPKGVDECHAPLLEPLACVTQSLLDPPVVNPGDQVLVVGAGAIGLLAAQVVKAQGAEPTVTGLAQDESRLEVARGMGIPTRTGGPGRRDFDVALECSGSEHGLRDCLESTLPGARVVQVGIFGHDVSVPMDRVLMKELVLSSGFASTPRSWRRALRLVERGLIELAPLVTGTFPLERWLEGFSAAADGAELKVVLTPA